MEYIVNDYITVERHQIVGGENVDHQNMENMQISE